MSVLLSQLAHFFAGKQPVADAFSGTIYSKAIKMNKAGRCMFGIMKGVGTTGTSTITVQAASDASHTGATAIPFKKLEDLDTTAGGEVLTAPTDVAAAGFVTTAGSAQLILIEVDAKDLPAGLDYVEVKAVESVDDPVVGAIFGATYDLRYQQAIAPAIT
jgi:hypothetical protein